MCIVKTDWCYNWKMHQLWHVDFEATVIFTIILFPEHKPHLQAEYTPCTGIAGESVQHI